MVPKNLEGDIYEYKILHITYKLLYKMFKIKDFENSTHTNFVENPLSKDDRDKEGNQYTARIKNIKLIQYHIIYSIFKYDWNKNLLEGEKNGFKRLSIQYSK